MGAFILGVLVGWLAEWLFYTYWVKAGDNQGDCSEIEAELELKNRQISSLQTQLASAGQASSSNTEKVGLTSSAGASTTSSAASSSSVSTSSAPKSSASKTNKDTTKASTAKGTASKPSSTKSSTAKTSTTKTSASKASTTKTAAKKAPAKKAKASGDNLTKVEGIGPKASAALKDAGVKSFADLANSSVPAIQKILDESDGRFGAMNPGSWPKQAKMAADGKWDELKKWQDEHDGGIEKK